MAADPIRSTNLNSTSTAVEFVVNYDNGPVQATGRLPLAAARELLTPEIELPIERVRKLYIVGHSWAYVDDASPLNSFRVALQAALDARYGAGAWMIVNYAVGGTALGPVGPSTRGLEQLTRVLAQDDADEILLVHGINDIALGRTATQFIADLSTFAAATSSIPLSVCTIGPFKGAAFYNATTRGYVDTINTHILTTFGGRAFDLWALFNDPSDDGAFLPAYRFDDFHPNHAGKVPWANGLVTQIDFGAAPAPGKVRIAGDVELDQDLSRIASPSFRALVLGTDDGVVRPLTVRSRDLLIDEEQIFLTQFNDPSSGAFIHADVGGNLLFKRFASGVSTVTRFLLSGIAAGFSQFVTKFWVQADGVNARFSGTTYAGGAGYAIEVSINSSTDGGITAFSSAGAAFGDLTIAARNMAIEASTGQNILFNTGGTTRVAVDGTSGAFWLPTCPHYASQAGALAAMGAGRVFYNTAKEALDISM